ncbi:MAG: MBOAT family protein [Ruminococcaceae bacterium]|nr:MBOAT family protein [Oscillospiraceae bacterium]
MLFTSLEFLFAFFPITFGVYFLLPVKARNYWLLLASLFFYSWGEPKFLIVMIVSIILNYIFAIRIEDAKDNAFQRKLFLVLAVVANLGLLFVYKYMNFVTSTLHEWFPVTKEMFEVTKIVLPIGISFFTFQSMSYVIDVYRGEPAQRNPFYVGLYVSLFPQLIAGPIVRYTTVAREINERIITKEMFTKGMFRFLKGFNKKVLLANILAEVADIAFAQSDLNFTLAWIGAICYTLQIFFDFSGYSEMAIGLGLMFGFKFLENFDYPYISKTITEFWRRWHISLGSWFRDYVYFPLGGSRVKSKVRLVFNLFVVWLATGIWHGASWNFILWGVLYGVIITVEKLLSLPKKLEEHKIPAVFYQIFTMLMVVFGWVLFRATDITSAGNYLSAMLGFGASGFIDDKTIHYLMNFIVMIVAGIICSVPLAKKLKEKISEKWENGEVICDTAEYIIHMILFVVSVSFLVMNAHNPFIYFNF